jgi:hypothetical protein
MKYSIKHCDVLFQHAVVRSLSHNGVRLKFECPCGATSDPIPSSSFTYHVYTTELRSANALHSDVSLDALLNYIANTEKKKCSEKECQIMNKPQRLLIDTIPKVFTVSLVWPSASPSPADIKEVLDVLSRSMDIDLRHVFYNALTSSSTKFKFRGMVCYYRMHYLAYFFSCRLGQWLVCDDTYVDKVTITSSASMKRRVCSIHDT